MNDFTQEQYEFFSHIATTCEGQGEGAVSLTRGTLRLSIRIVLVHWLVFIFVFFLFEEH